MSTLALAGLVAGFVVLIFGSRWAVRGAVGVAESLSVGRLSIGFVLVAMTTTLPEIFVSVSASLQGETGLAVGNAVGSSVANLTVIVGSAILVAGALVPGRHALQDLVEVLFLAGLVSVFLLTAPTLTALRGVGLLGVFAYFLYKARQAPALVPAAAQAKNDRSRSLLLFFGAAALVLAASELVVRSSVSLLAATGVSPEVLGLTVVAVGTSLPELSVLAQAIRAGEHDLALGDLFGACTVNLTLILGAVAVVGGGPVDLAPLSGAVPFLLAGILLWWYLLVRNRPASRRLAILLIAAYAAFALQQLGWLFPARG